MFVLFDNISTTAHDYQPGASLTVTRTNAGRLLKDFNVDWWFAPLSSMSDVGSPELTAGLLSLQHTGVVRIKSFFP